MGAGAQGASRRPLATAAVAAALALSLAGCAGPAGCSQDGAGDDAGAQDAGPAAITATVDGTGSESDSSRGVEGSDIEGWDWLEPQLGEGQEAPLLEALSSTFAGRDKGELGLSVVRNVETGTETVPDGSADVSTPRTGQGASQQDAPADARPEAGGSGGSAAASGSVRLEARPAAQARSYEYQLASDPSFGSVVATRETQETSVSFDGLEPGREYWARYRAKRDAGDGRWSAAVSVTASRARASAWAPGQPTARRAAAGLREVRVVRSCSFACSLDRCVYMAAWADGRWTVTTVGGASVDGGTQEATPAGPGDARIEG